MLIDSLRFGCQKPQKLLPRFDSGGERVIFFAAIIFIYFFSFYLWVASWVFIYRVCVAQLLPGGRNFSKGLSGKHSATSIKERPLLKGGSLVSCHISKPIDESEQATAKRGKEKIMMSCKKGVPWGTDWPRGLWSFRFPGLGMADQGRMSCWGVWVMNHCKEQIGSLNYLKKNHFWT